MNVVPQDWAGHSAILNGGLLVSLQWTWFHQGQANASELECNRPQWSPTHLKQPYRVGSRDCRQQIDCLHIALVPLPVFTRNQTDGLQKTWENGTRSLAHLPWVHVLWRFELAPLDPR